MGVITCNDELKFSIPLSKMYKTLVMDTHCLLPELLPQVIKSVEFEEGNGGVGTVYKTNFVDGFPFKYMKHRVDIIDASNYSFKYTKFEGDALGDKYEKVESEGKYEAQGDGCVVKVQTHYHTKGDIKEDVVKAEHAQELEVYKIVEHYLLANPDYA